MQNDVCVSWQTTVGDCTLACCHHKQWECDACACTHAKRCPACKDVDTYKQQLHQRFGGFDQLIESKRDEEIEIEMMDADDANEEGGDGMI